MQKVLSSKRSDRGAALLVAVVIIGVLVVFTFSLLLVSYTLYASQNKKAASTRCSEAANTMSRALQVELCDSEAYLNSDLWNYLRFNLVQTTTWPYYDINETAGHTKKDAYRYFVVEYNTSDHYLTKVYQNQNAPEGYPAVVQLCIYWMPPEGYNASDYQREALTNLDIELEKDIRLYIEITCESGNQSYTVVNKYNLKPRLFWPEETMIQEKLNENAVLKYSKAQGETQYMYNPWAFSLYHNNENWIWEWDSRE